jgi:localization factor PodJL
MKSAVSWSIEGVAPQARETAREAARRAGLSVGEWLNAAIIDSAGDADVQPPSASRRDDESPRRLAAAIGRLSERLEHLIDGRAALESEGQAAAGRALPPVHRGSAPSTPEDWSLGIEQAVAEISGRQRMLDDGTPRTADRSFDTADAATRATIPLQDIAGLEDHLRHISSQIETLQRPCPFEGDVSGMRRDLAEIKHTLGEAMPRYAMEVLEDQIRALESRVEQRRNGTDGVALAGVELRLARIGEALNRLAPAENLSGLDEEVGALSRKIDAVASHGPDPATMQQLEAAIAELRHVSERVASGDALMKLGNEVRALGAKIDRFDSATTGMDAVSALERRMEVLAGTLTEYATNVGRNAAPDVEALVQGVSERLERLHSVRAEQAAFENLEEQIARLSDKLDASDGRMAQLGGLERTLADLFLQIEDTRTGAIEAAERAAKAAARELSVTEAGDQVAVEMLKRDLTDLREAQSDTDRRTHQTLETLHDAVQRMVDRMANIDFSRPAEARSNPPAAEPARAPAPSEERAPPRPPVASPPPAPPPAARTVPPAVAPQPPAMPQQPALPPAAAAFTPPAERRPIDPTLPADTPLEPGSGGPRLRPGATPAERIAASEAALGTAKPKAAERGEKANFIAAARRAAQAAAADAAATNPQSDEASETRAGGIAQVLGKHKRSLLMATGAIVIAAGTLQFASGMLKTSDAPSSETARSASKDTKGGREPVAALTPPPAANAAAPTAAEPSAPATSAANDLPDIANVPPGLPASLTPIKVAGDITGSIPKPQKTAALTAASPIGMLFAPPMAAPADPSKLPPAIGASLRAAATNGDAGAAYEVALRFAEGRGVPASLEEAARWFRRAADRGLAPAQYRLGSLLEKGQGVKKDVEAARLLYSAAAEKGNAKAMHNLAVLYAEGVDGKPDYRTASQWFRKAADRGVADSEYNLGILYARGIGVEQNLAESYKWFSLAAAQGDQDAGRKRDDVAARLDAQALAAAKLAVQTFQPEAQPDEAINVKAPPGGWDHAATSAAPTKNKPKKIGSL